MYSVSDKIIISFSLFLYSESGILSRISNFCKYFSLKLLLDNVFMNIFFIIIHCRGAGFNCYAFVICLKVNLTVITGKNMGVT